MRNALLFIMVLAVLATACSRVEQPYRTYSDQAAAVSAGEATRGWIPSWLPNSATNLHLQTDLDTNRAWLRFDLPSQDRGAILAYLTPIPWFSVEGMSPPTRPASSSGWWFEGLIQHQPANDGALNCDLYLVRPESGVSFTHVAFDRVSERVFLW